MQDSPVKTVEKSLKNAAVNSVNSYEEHINCSLLAFILEIIDVCPGNALGCVGENACNSVVSN